MSGFTHITDDGDAHMVDIAAKPETKRIAIATGHVRMQPETLEMIRQGDARKGDVLAVAQVAGIMAAKKTADLVPLCHPLSLTHVGLTLAAVDTGVAIRAEVHTTGKTGVEMEALTAVSVAALTVYDMVKAVDRGMVIETIQLERKSGGASGVWERETDRT